jgi:sugar/nucleoside kinase (ribokinase family)
MPVVIVGSLAFDTIHTPFDKREKILGGACTYSAIAASHFTKPMIVGPVGEDFTDKYIDLLVKKGIDTAGVKREKGRSFFWEGKYHLDMNTRDTLKTELNVFEKFDPVLPESYKDAPYLFLANIDPPLQSKVLSAMRKLKFSMVDTMNMWIELKKPELIEVFKKVDCVVLNDSEIRQFTGKTNLIHGAREIQKIGPKYVIIKKGEHGASIVGKQGFYFPSHSYPVEDVIDPTGAGDSFAGAFIGYIASQNKVNEAVLKKALVYGNATASFTVEGFGTERLAAITRNDIDRRVEDIRKIGLF